jgi:hypothetical protein
MAELESRVSEIIGPNRIQVLETAELASLPIQMSHLDLRLAGPSGRF